MSLHIFALNPALYIFQSLTDILKYRPEYKVELLDISAEALGQGYVSETEFDRCLENNNHICFIALKNNIVVGYTLLEIFDVGDLKSAFNFDIYDTILSERDVKRVCYRKHTVVRKEFRNHGTGKALVRFSHRQIEAQVDCIFSLVWKNESNIMIKILEKEGFNQKLTLPDYWRESSLERRFSCPLCGIPCHCEAVLMVWYG